MQQPVSEALDDVQPARTRRDVIASAWKVGGIALALEALWVSLVMLRPSASDKTGKRLVFDAPDAFAETSATYVPAARFYITKVKGELFALSQACPHLGCSVPFCEASGLFECPCHGSKYNLAGEWLEGPSPHGMNRYPLTIEDDRVVVNTAQLDEGPPLGQRNYATPERGGSCAPEG
jgi:nitrite reductase/ring-hydroxylating ferredoxin subunit